MKKILTMAIVSMILIVNCIPVSANNLTYTHGNDNSSKKCFAQTSQTGTDSIGALITWQLSGTNQVVYGSVANSTGYSARSSSKALKGKSGKSYGYFYHNGSEVHRSTSWYSFSF